MKTILASLIALLIAICAIPLRARVGLDTQHTPVNRWLWLRSEIVNQPRFYKARIQEQDRHQMIRVVVAGPAIERGLVRVLQHQRFPRTTAVECVVTVHAACIAVIQLNPIRAAMARAALSFAVCNGIVVR